MRKQEIQKITACLPKTLLQDAQHYTGLGITETLKEGLMQLILAKTYEDIRQFRGKVNPSIDINELRKDRDEI